MNWLSLLIEPLPKIERYWNLSFQKRQPTSSVGEAAEELRGLLADATKM